MLPAEDRLSAVNRVLLVLPSATYRASDFLEAADHLGAEVVVASDEQQALAEVMGTRALVLDLDSPRQAARTIVDHARRWPLDGLVAVDDQGVLPVALAAERLGLPHNAPEAVAATRDKASLRRALAGRVDQPAFRVVGPGDDVATLADEVGWPCVLKPVSLSASRGVIRADDPAAAAAAARRIRAIVVCEDEDPAGPLLVEEYLEGEEVALEGLLRGGKLEVLAVFDKPDPLTGPYFEETLYVTPSRKPPEVLDEVVATTRRATTAIGLSEGPIHAELRIAGDGRVRFLEVAARSIGGLCARALRFGLGVSLEELILRHALELPLDTLRREPAASGVMMLPIPRAGRLEDVRGQEAARAVAGIVGLEITAPRGQRVEPLPESDRYLGFLFARGEHPANVEESLRAASNRLEVVITPTEAAAG